MLTHSLPVDRKEYEELLGVMYAARIAKRRGYDLIGREMLKEALEKVERCAGLATDHGGGRDGAE